MLAFKYFLFQCGIIINFFSDVKLYKYISEATHNIIGMMMIKWR